MLKKLNFRLLGKLLFLEHVLLVVILFTIAPISAYVWLYVAMWLGINFFLGVTLCLNIGTIVDGYSKLSYALHYISPFLFVGLPIVIIVLICALGAGCVKNLSEDTKPA